MILAAEDLGDLLDPAVLLSLPGVLVLAWLVGRLLGVRRSWTMTLLSGVIGWIGGVALSLAIASQRNNPDTGFTRNVWLDRMANQIERGNFRARVSLFSDEHDERVVTKLVNRTVLALTGGVVGVIGAMLINVRGGPPFAGQTSLYEFFGYFSLFCAVVLIMRVIVSVLHDGVN